MGWVIVMGGPSGSGKSTVGGVLERTLGWTRMITVTTRAPRPGEVNGKDYWFLTQEQFDKADARGLLGEKTVYVGNDLRYGIYRRDMEAARARKKPTYVILNAEGLRILRRYYGPRKVTGVFLWAPRHVLAQRMAARGDDEITIRRRLARYKEEMATGQQFPHRLNTEGMEPGSVAVAVWNMCGIE